jgi:RNA polymerase sigma factor (sigma-70 family)
MLSASGVERETGGDAAIVRAGAAQQNGPEKDRTLWKCRTPRKICWTRSSRCYRDRFADFVAVAASIVGERESAREAVQDAFASIVRSRRDFRGEAPLEAWVWRAVINAARKKKRRYAREAHARATAPVMNGTAPDRDEGSELATLVATLPERQRLVLFLRYYADLDYLRIAQILGVRTGTVSASLHAAHRTLRQALNEVV